MVDAILNSWYAGSDRRPGDQPGLWPRDYKLAKQLADRIARLPEVGQIYIPQDMDYPGLRMDVSIAYTPWS